MAAREAARSAASLDELRAILERFEGCALRTTATQLVFADGNPQARVMFVGEAPGREEDIEGLPFVGRSGKLLDRMLAAIGLDRTSAYIANIVPWRPPGNRTPTPQESAICLPFILRQIELADPDVLVCLGIRRRRRCSASRTASPRRAGAGSVITPARARSARIADVPPGLSAAQPLQKRLAWRDFLAIKKALADSRLSEHDPSSQHHRTGGSDMAKTIEHVHWPDAPRHVDAVCTGDQGHWWHHGIPRWSSPRRRSITIIRTGPKSSTRMPRDMAGQASRRA